MDGTKPLDEEAYKAWLDGAKINVYCGRDGYSFSHDATHVWCNGPGCYYNIHSDFPKYMLQSQPLGFYYYTGEIVKEPVYRLIDKVDGKLRYYTLEEIK